MQVCPLAIDRANIELNVISRYHPAAADNRREVCVVHAVLSRGGSGQFTALQLHSSRGIAQVLVS